MQSDYEIIRQVYELVKNGWTQYAAALGWFGLPVDPLSEDAQSWCLVGAMGRACGGKPMDEIWKLFSQYLGNHGVATWNDTPGRTQTEVLTFLELLLTCIESIG